MKNRNRKKGQSTMNESPEQESRLTDPGEVESPEEIQDLMDSAETESHLETPRPEIDLTELRQSPAPEQKYAEILRNIAHNQMSVNTAMAGDDWAGVAKDHGKVDYAMAALDEFAEFWRCAWNLKWWDKSADNDIDLRNARMELVDLLHFLVSEDIVLYVALNEEVLLDQAADGVVINMLTGVVSVFEEYEDIEATEPTLKDSMKTVIRGLCDLKKPFVDWNAFWWMCISYSNHADASTRLQEILDLYMAKAVLNKFRTRHRATGKYNKVWIDGREDNACMMSWLDAQQAANGSMPSSAEIDSWLEATYSRILFK